MNERDLWRLFQRILTSSLAVQAALGGAACGGTVTGTAGQADPGGDASGGVRGDPLPPLSGTGGAGGGFLTGPVPCQAGQCGATGGAGGQLVLPPGSGGAFVFGGGGAPGAGGFPDDGGVDAAAHDPCVPGPPGGFCPPGQCVPLPPDLAAPPDGGSIDAVACQRACPDSSYEFCEIVSSQGEGRLKCYQFCEGRRPEGLLATAVSDDSLGAYFARIAHAEAASVAAFRRLHRELTCHGAPHSLRRSARRAARDEIRHTRVTREFAHRYGGVCEAPRIEPLGDRSLEAMAIENAIEGCVRETYGALTATFRARHATDPAIRKAMRAIARDETRHAALAWRVDGWLERRLDPSARRRVLAERRAAAARLIQELGDAPPQAAVAVAGAPAPDIARAMARAMVERIARSPKMRSPFG